MPKRPPAVLIMIPLPLVFGIAAAFVVGLVTGSFVAAWLTLAGVMLAMAIALYFAAERIVLHVLEARPLGEHESVLLRNSLEELCARTGHNEPPLYTIGAGTPAIASLGRRRPSLVVTEGLTDALTVVELEAALARELARSDMGSTMLDTVAVPFITLPLAPFGTFGQRVLQWFRGGDHDALCDVAAIEITRYPPGLAAALRKMATHTGGSAAVLHLWAVGADPEQRKPGVYALDERLELLGEL